MYKYTPHQSLEITRAKAAPTTRKEQAELNRSIKGFKKEIATEKRNGLATDRILTGLLVAPGVPHNSLAQVKELQRQSMKRIAQGIEQPKQERGIDRDDERW